MKLLFNRMPLVLAILFATVLWSCNDQHQPFTEIQKRSESLSNYGDTLKIRSYNVIYNPKASGYIQLTLEDNSKYEAKSVDGGSFSAINALLKEPEVMFDKNRKEVFLNHVITP